MQKVAWVTSLFLILTPLVALGWGGAHVWTHGVAVSEIAIFLFMVAATGFSITAGYHRHFAHGAYECRRFVKVAWLLFGAASFQHSVLSWASEHRRHHRNIDREDDPYNIRKGFLWAHIGWLFWEREDDFSNIRDLSADPWIVAQHRYYIPVSIAMGFGFPLAVGFLVGNPWGCLLWGGFIRIVFVHHSTFFVNSLAHTLGSRPYTLAVSARDSLVTALLTFGEGYHNFHHRFATDYRNGVRFYQWDPTKWLIRGMAALGWAYDLYRVPREKIVEAELKVDAQRVIVGWKDRSEHAVGHLKERLAEVGAAVHRAAERLGELERQIAQAGREFGRERRRQLEQLRLELRVARREFRDARRRWREAIAELNRLPALPAPA